MKSILIYSSKYGATRQYADWIGKALEIPIVDAEDAITHEIIQNDTFIIGSSVYIGRLRIRKWLKKNLDLLKNKRIILFLVCGTPVEEKEKWSEYIRQSVPEALMPKCSVHVLPGRMWFERVNAWDRFLLRLNASATSNKETKRMMLKGYDQVERKNIMPVLEDFHRLIIAPEESAMRNYQQSNG
ncbi:flavodoxin domain-containing protein [Pollutibacter soli]|uniref:flavodoxin domain-containing protein n=1 Tax=Pollutibacter soli TaxID=3034157 RepID=UPI00301344EB